MKKSRFTEAEIVGLLKEAECGIMMAAILHKHGISGATFYKGDLNMGALKLLSSSGSKS